MTILFCISFRFLPEQKQNPFHAGVIRRLFLPDVRSAQIF